jgi:hypothetical protein
MKEIKMKLLDEKTFGDTPAAMYLARVLNELGSSNLVRSAGKRITATKKQVNDLEISYIYGLMSAKTAANCFRLMRLDVTNEPSKHNFFDKSKERLLEQLIRNVQIGYIKRGIRLCSVARKAERKVEVSHERNAYTMIKLYDQQSDKYVNAGFVDEDGIKTFVPIMSDDIETITPELLHLRSNRRCIRLGKPHAKIN